MPPANFSHEQEKIAIRWPEAIDYIVRHKLNETFSGAAHQDLGIIVQGGMYNGLIRALELAGMADRFGQSQVPLYVLNVTYPLVDHEIEAFCRDKRAVLVVEEGQPEYLEQAIGSILRRSGVAAILSGKDVFPRAGEYTGQVIGDGLAEFLSCATGTTPKPARAVPALQLCDVPPRPAGFCTGCPERPVFTAMKLLQQELGPIHVSCDIGCHLFSILPPFNIVILIENRIADAAGQPVVPEPAIAHHADCPPG